MNLLKYIAIPLMLILGGCSFFSEEEKEEFVAPLVSLGHEAISLESVWTRGIGNLGDDALHLSLTPAIADDSIYVVNADGRVMSLNRATGNVNWAENLDKKITSSVGAGFGLVVVADKDGGIIAMNSSDGSTRWRSQASSEVLAAPATDGDVVVVQSVDSRVQAFDAKSGSPRWVYSASQSVLSLRGNAAPVILNGKVFVAFDNGKAAALDAATGLLQWEQRFIIPDGRSELERVIDVQSAPLVVGSEVYLGAYQGSVVNLSAATGEPQWQEKASVSASMSASDGNLYLIDKDDKVRALRLANGREAWKSELFTGRKLSSPAVLGEYIVFVDKEAYGHLLTQSEGTYSGRYSVGGGGTRAGILSDGIYIYVLNNAGKLSALKLDK